MLASASLLTANKLPLLALRIPEDKAVYGDVPGAIPFLHPQQELLKAFRVLVSDEW